MVEAKPSGTLEEVTEYQKIKKEQLAQFLNMKSVRGLHPCNNKVCIDYLNSLDKSSKYYFMERLFENEDISLVSFYYENGLNMDDCIESVFECFYFHVGTVRDTWYQLPSSIKYKRRRRNPEQLKSIKEVIDLIMLIILKVCSENETKRKKFIRTLTFDSESKHKYDIEKYYFLKLKDCLENV